MTTSSLLGPFSLVFGLYIVATLAVGALARRRSQSAADYLSATRALPFGAVLGAYVAANCGALEIVGLSAMAAEYGATAFHFYLIGAVPAMIFLGLFLMPVYRRNGVTSVPQLLQARYGSGMRLLNAVVTAVVLLLLGGVSLYALGQVVTVLTRLSFAAGAVLCVAVVTAYVLAGGLRATVYNELLQLAVMVAGLLPLAVHCLHLRSLWTDSAIGWKAHLWRGMPLVAPAARMDLFGVIFGLGCVLSFSYWCTDFVLMQRAFAARTEFQARQVPLCAGFGKLLFSALVVLPGLSAAALLPGLSGRYDTALPQMMRLVYGPWMLSLGVTALAASLMSALAANLSAFASVVANDLLPFASRREMGQARQLAVGRAVVVLAAAASVLLSYLNFFFSNIMEHVQLIFSVLGAPFWAVFLLGALTRRVQQGAAMAGFLSGAAVSLLHSALVMGGVLHYGSNMSANFYAAVLGFAVSATVMLGAQGLWPGRAAAGERLRWAPTSDRGGELTLLWVLAGALFTFAVTIGVLWR